MTLNEAEEYINNHTWSASRLGLERTRELLNKLGNPQKRLRFVHVAGTNGKGSTSAMLASVLKEAGYRTGLYPSPYIEDFRERIQVNGEMIPGEELAGVTEKVKDAAESMSDHPSQFEMITAIGMLYFLKMRCDIVILEVGMGGRLDSTNVIDAPLAAVITNIGLDHTEYLGDTAEKIAAEKAGIIKPGCDAVVYDNVPSVMRVIENACSRSGVRMLKACGRVREAGHSLYGQTFYYNDEDAIESEGAENSGTRKKNDLNDLYELSLLGAHQLKNAEVVLLTVSVLRRKGFDIPDEAVKAGLKNVRWPARFEVLSHDPLFILDGGHNPQCAESLAENLRLYLPWQKVMFILGVLADKDYEGIIRILMPFAAGFVCLTPDNPRALNAAELAGKIKLMYKRKDCGMPAEVRDSAKEAIRCATGSGYPVIAFGSLYMAGDIRKSFRCLDLVQKL